MTKGVVAGYQKRPTKTCSERKLSGVHISDPLKYFVTDVIPKRPMCMHKLPLMLM